MVYTRILRRFVVPPRSLFLNTNVTRNYLTQNIQYMHNEEDDIELQSMLFQKIWQYSNVSVE